MHDTRVDELGRGHERLAEALVEPSSGPVLQVGCIQYFALCFELTWKCTKAALEDEGIEALSPRATIKAAFGLGWVASDATWLEMLHARSTLAHTCDMDEALAAYANLPRFRASMRALCDVLRGRGGEGKETLALYGHTDRAQRKP